MASKTAHSHLERWFLIIVSALLLIVFWRIVEPFLLVVITAAAAGIVSAPLQRRLVKKVKKESTAAIIISILMFLVVVIPVAILLFFIIGQASELVAFLNGAGGQGVFAIQTLPLYDALPTLLQEQLMTLDIREVTQFIADWIVGNVGQLFSSTASIGLNLFIFFIAFYYILTSRKHLQALAFELSPLVDTVDAQILKKVEDTVRGVVFGSLLVALIQGVVATIGMVLLGVPGAVIWGVLTTILAPIPIVGTALVMLPVAFYLFAVGNIVAGIIMLVLLIAVGMIYNVLAPKLIQGKTKMNAFLILISLLGGLNLFGPIGFIVGPSVLAMLIVLVDLYRSGAFKKL